MSCVTGEACDNVNVRINDTASRIRYCCPARRGLYTVNCVVLIFTTAVIDDDIGWVPCEGGSNITTYPI